MSPELTSELHSLLLTVLTGVVTVIGVYLRNMISKKTQSMQSGIYKLFAERVVAYAEQKIAGAVQKNTYVSATISQKFPELSQDEVQHLLEAAVLSLQAPKAVTPCPTTEVPK